MENAFFRFNNLANARHGIDFDFKHVQRSFSQVKRLLTDRLYRL